MLYNQYLAEISRGQEQAKVLGKEGLSNKQVAAAYRGALEAAYNAEAGNRDFALRKKLGEGNLEIQQDTIEAEKQAERTRTMTQLGTLALTNSDKLVKGYNLLTGAFSGTTGAAETGIGVAGTSGAGAYGAAGMLGPAYGAEGIGVAGTSGAGAYGAAGMLGPAYGAAETGIGVAGTAGEVGIAGASAGEAGAGVAAGTASYLGPAGIGFTAGSILGPMIGKALPFGGSKEKGAIGGAIAGSILGGISAGAMAGTAVFPVVGTVIGAICGAIGGLFGGGK